MARSKVARLIVAALCALCASCSTPAEDVVDKLRDSSDQYCKQGNDAACHTIVQVLGDTKIGIQSTAAIDEIAADCHDGKADECQQLAVMHVQLSHWCNSGNTRACEELSSNSWPKDWDEPALIDAARMGCIKGTFDAKSNTCQALGSL